VVNQAANFKFLGISWALANAKTALTANQNAFSINFDMTAFVATKAFS
jgi:hypothetical protein